MPGLVVHEPNFILPVMRVRRVGGVSRAVAFAGTGFVLEGGLFVTCWHCVDAPLKEHEAYVALRHASNAGTTQAGEIALIDLAQDTNGVDLALARIDHDPVPGLLVAGVPAVGGEEVETFGYPLVPPPKGDGEDQVFDIPGRLLRGYSTRVFDYEHPDGSRIPSIELDMVTPEGLSGAPLLRRGTPEVLGVVFGTNDVAKIESWSRTDPATGLRTPEVERIVSFGLAHWTRTLREARGPATGGERLGDVHDRAVCPGR